MSIQAVRTLFYQAMERLRSKRLHYEYIDWLAFANAGMLNRGNILCFDYAIRNLPAESTALEIGSFCGLSTNVISHLIERHGKKTRLFTCDEWKFENSEGPNLPDSSVSREAYRDFCRQSFIRNVNFFSASRTPHTIEKSSDDFFDLWRKSAKATDIFGRDVTLGGPLHFVYIDGDHTYEATRRDFDNADAALAPGGFILLDDSARSFPFGCYKVAKEVMKDSRYRLVMRNPNFLFQKK
jgi:hypothetical protein